MTPPPHNGNTDLTELEARLVEALEFRMMGRNGNGTNGRWKAELLRLVIIAAVSMVTTYFAMDKKISLLDLQINGKYGIADKLDQLQMDINELLRRVK